MARKHFSPKERRKLLEAVAKDGLSVSQACRQFGVSRFTFYKWAKQDQSKAGKKHFRSIGGKREKLILECVLRNPDWNSHHISNYLKVYQNGKYAVSNHGVHNVLKRYSLNTLALRHQFSRGHQVKTVFAHKLADFEKYFILEEVASGKKIAAICRQYHISRYTYYAWLKKYRQNRTIATLAAARPRGQNHPRFVGHKIASLVLDLVAKNPQYSVHKLYRHLGGLVGHHAIQNLLVRSGLNTYQRRFAYYVQGSQESGVKVKVAPLYRPEMPVYRLRMLLAPFVTVPKLWAFSLLPVVILGLWIRMLVTAPPQTSFLGLVLASIALFFGFVFFLYSLNYYIGIMMVLKLAQTGGKDS